MKVPKYSKLYAQDVNTLANEINAQGKSWRWHIARPQRYYSKWHDLLKAVDVFLGRADAIYWEIDEDK